MSGSEVVWENHRYHVHCTHPVDIVQDVIASLRKYLRIIYRNLNTVYNHFNYFTTRKMNASIWTNFFENQSQGFGQN